ncbi:MAG: histidine kinase, partial [Candidatus Acidiferrales bacterium]
MQSPVSGKELLFTLVLKVGFAASLAALLVRFSRFRRVLFTEQRDSDQKALLLLFLTPPLALAVVLRLVGYDFFDLTLAGSFLMGLIGGRMVGLLGASMLSLPAFGNHEWLATPMAALVGLFGGLIRQGLPNTEDIWHFGPFLFLNIPQSLWKLVRRGQINWAMLPLGACVALELGRYALARVVPARWLYTLPYPSWPWLLLIVLATVMSVAMPVKIWNNTRIEMNLEQNEQLLLKARMDALSRQINPHFLFNTLNTVSSLVRYDPDMARIVVLKLSNILRRLLRTHETFVPL